jgi:hypothetical protein
MPLDVSCISIGYKNRWMSLTDPPWALNPG